MMARVNKVVGLLGAVLLFALMMLTVVDVFGRSVLNRPLPGASELTEIALACIVFFLLPQISFERRHIAVDLISHRVPRVVQVALDVLGAVTGFALFALIGWRLWHLATTAVRYGDTTPTLGLPLAPILYLVAVLALVNACAFLATIPGALKKKRAAESSGPPDAGFLT